MSKGNYGVAGAKLFRFQELEIWKKAIAIGDKLFDIADTLEKQKLYRFAEQVRGAGFSISNKEATMNIDNHIITDPEILGGKPIIRGTRISVEFILELFASGAAKEEILRNYPHINEEDIYAALRYASKFLKNEIVFELDTV